jgi:hypothetical protein
VQRLGIASYVRKPPDLEEFLRIGEILKRILLESRRGRPQKIREA